MGHSRGPAVLVGLALTVAACGDGPTAPTLPDAPQTTISVHEVRDGLTDALIPGAGIVGSSTVTVTAPGYPPRVQAIASVVWLWPQEEGYLRQTVYGWTGLLMRWSGPTVRLGLDQSISDRRGILERGARAMSEASGLSVIVAEPADVRITLDPTLDVTGRTWATLAGGEIYAMLIRLQSQEMYDWGDGFIVAHELAHALGLFHSPDTDDVVNEAAWHLAPWRGSYGVEETKALRMMYYKREAGNRPPDTAPGVAATARRTVEISCPRF